MLSHHKAKWMISLLTKEKNIVLLEQSRKEYIRSAKEVFPKSKH